MSLTAQSLLTHTLKLCSVLNMLQFSVGMKKELQTLREEIKALVGQIQRKLKGEFSLNCRDRLLFLFKFVITHQFFFSRH